MPFYYLSHALQSWLLPPGFNLLIAFIGFLLLRLQKQLGRALIFFSFISLWILSTPMFGQLLLNGLQNQYPSLQLQSDKIDTEHQPAAIIVLGGGQTAAPEYDNKRVVSRSTLLRLQYATYLHHKTSFPIIVSGGRLEGVQYTEADLMKNELKTYFNIPNAWNEEKSIATKDEAELMVPVLKEHGVKVAYLVTNAWHMPRSMYAFNAALSHTDIHIVAAPMGYDLLETHHGFLNYLPSITGLNMSTTAIHEYLGVLSYFLS